MRFASIALAVAGAALASAIDTIEIKDRHFVTSSGKPFYIKGIDYQPGGSASISEEKKGWDPLEDAEKCARDIIVFQKLGINTIRIYSVDPKVNHDECMTMLAAAGIYLVLDVNSPIYGQHLHATEPWTTYTEDYLEHVFSVMEAFAGYDNTLAFLSGNEVVHEKGSEKTAPMYIKAVTRDMKAYSKKNLKRQIPVGYSNADNIEFRVSLSRYMECGTEGNVDFFGVNSYQWCGKNTFEGSGYDKLVDNFDNYTIPVFFSEYGCNEVRPREWEETAALYSDKMTHVFSGGLVYEYSLEANDYGLVEIESNGDAKLTGEFDTLEKVMSTVGDIEIPSDTTKGKRPETCGSPKSFPGIVATNDLPKTFATKFVNAGVDKSKYSAGALLDLKSVKTETKYKIFNSDGSELGDASIDKTNTDNGKKEDKKNAAGAVKVAFGFTAVAALVASFTLF